MGNLTRLENIACKNVSFSYSPNEAGPKVLNDISLSIRKGEFVSIVGPSGCGKSTLLSLLAGLRQPSDGTILIDGKKILGAGLDRGVVFQHYSLFPWMSARKNLMFALKQTTPKRSGKQLEAIADSWLERVGLTQFAGKYPSELSGGMQQRVAIARAFALDPAILLMDEPFSAVDTKNRVALQEMLLRLWDNEGRERKTVIFITHDIDEAILLADRVVVMSALTGAVRKEIAVDFKRPRNRGALMKSPEYGLLRSEMVDLFHEDEAEILAEELSQPECAVNG